MGEGVRVFSPLPALSNDRVKGEYRAFCHSRPFLVTPAQAGVCPDYYDYLVIQLGQAPAGIYARGGGLGYSPYVGEPEGVSPPRRGGARGGAERQSIRPPYI